MRWLLPGLMIVASVLIAKPVQHRVSHLPTIGRLSEQEREEAIEFIEEYGGALRLKKLENIKWRAPLEYENHLRTALIKKRDLERLRENNEILYQKILGTMDMERESFNLAEEYRNAESDAERNDIKEQLRGILSRVFDLKQDERNSRISNLEDKINRLKDDLAERARNKNEIVERRLGELLGEGRYLEW